MSKRYTIIDGEKIEVPYPESCPFNHRAEGWKNEWCHHPSRGARICENKGFPEHCLLKGEDEKVTFNHSDEGGLCEPYKKEVKK